LNSVGLTYCLPSTPNQSPCEAPSLTWRDVTARELNSSFTGGLGRLMTLEIEVWVCLIEPSLAVSCGGGGGGGNPRILEEGGNQTSAGNASKYTGWSDLACYVYNEATGLFVFWGPNSVLELVPMPSP